ncbi:MAG: hypothetical protein IJE17_12395 [Clostridia bacterium]|nr:hypothetical protein [Clostridia bacterium]
MEQLGNELEKVLKAGIGAVATGVEKTKEAIESLAQKGEPLYAQAKDAVNDAAEKIKKAVSESGIADVFSCRPRVESIIADLQEMTQEELDEIRQALEDIYPTRPASREEAPAPEAEEPPDEEDSDEE